VARSSEWSEVTLLPGAHPIRGFRRRNNTKATKSLELLLFAALVVTILSLGRDYCPPVIRVINNPSGNGTFNIFSKRLQ
jgi:hypothetical protein